MEWETGIRLGAGFALVLVFPGPFARLNALRSGEVSLESIAGELEDPLDAGEAP